MLKGPNSAHSVIAAVLKRLAHRNPNVQLYALSLAESLSKNLGIELHREIASKAFTQGLEKLVTDRVSDTIRGCSSTITDLETTEYTREGETSGS